MAQPRKIVLLHNRAPGDITVLTSLVRDIALAHPGKFQIDVETTCMELWNHNPYLTPIKGDKKARAQQRDVEYLKIQYGKGIREQNHETIHFLAYFHRDFQRQTGVTVPLLHPYPDLHLSPEEVGQRVVDGRYWVVIAGGKSDFTAKVWHLNKTQAVVDGLVARGLGVVQIGSNDKGHWHPPLRNVLNLVAQTSLRDLLRLIAQADGVICPVTGAMHMAAALHRPCVVLAGGREAWWWEAYVNENRGFGPLASGKIRMPHRYLHTIGLLDCCKFHGCWRNKVVPLNGDKSLCSRPVMHPGQAVPLCLDMITPEHVLEAVMGYYADGSLPPITATPLPCTTPVAEVAATVATPAPPVPAPAVLPRRRLLDLDAPAAPAPPPPPAAPTPAKPATNPPGTKSATHKHCQVRVPIPKELLAGGVVPKVNTTARLEGKGNRSTAVAMQPGATPVIGTAEQIFQHPDVGGKFTVCTLLYGPESFADLHKRCLDSILTTVPPDRMDLRVGSNALNATSLAYVESLVAKGLVTKHYRHPNNDYKYPVMREMFWDPAHPINTKWVIWFDDDSIADREAAWLSILGQAIIQHHQKDKAHMFGAKFVWTLSPAQQALIRQRPWYHGRPFRAQNGQPTPNGNRVIFCTGGWFAISAEAIRVCNIPDTSPEMGLTHNGGDWLIGEQLYQGGFDTKAFNGSKQFINTSSVPRRGITMPMPGMTTPLPPKLRAV